MRDERFVPLVNSQRWKLWLSALALAAVGACHVRPPHSRAASRRRDSASEGLQRVGSVTIGSTAFGPHAARCGRSPPTAFGKAPWCLIAVKPLSDRPRLRSSARAVNRR